MWLMLVGLIVIALVGVLLMPEVRRGVMATGCAIVAVIALLIGADVTRSFVKLWQDDQQWKRTEAEWVELQDLQLTGTSRKDYRLTGLFHNRSRQYRLSHITIDLIVDDCVAGRCREQAHGRTEVIQVVEPNETEKFTTQMVELPDMPAPRGERRFSYRVISTRGH